MLVQPYLMFDGKCDEAVEFYKSAVGAEVLMLIRFKESPTPAHMIPPGAENKVMHMTMRMGESLVMATDGHCKGGEKFSGFSLSLSTGTDADAAAKFAALSSGGTVTMPMGKTFFSSSFGMVTDRYGLNWIVIVQ